MDLNISALAHSADARITGIKMILTSFALHQFLAPRQLKSLGGRLVRLELILPHILISCVQ